MYMFDNGDFDDDGDFDGEFGDTDGDFDDDGDLGDDDGRRLRRRRGRGGEE